MSVTNPERVVTKQDLADFYDELLPFISPKSYAGFTPIGTIIPMIAESAPANYLICNGATYNKSDYPELAAHLLSMTSHSMYEVSGDNTKFKVPDLSGEFLRGTGTNSHAYQGDGEAVGVHQMATVIPWVYTNFTDNKNRIAFSKRADRGNVVVTPSYTDYRNDGETYAKYGLTGDITVYTSSSVKADAYTTRPTNTSVLFCIATKNIYLDPKNDYSTEEKVIGTWINGETLYQKTVELGALPNATSKNVAHNISNLGIVVSFTGVAYNSSGQYIPLNFPSESNVANSVTFRIMSTNLQVMAGIDRSSFTGYATLQYTKTS